MKVHFFTLGCKTNQYETNAMEQNLSKNGFEIVDGFADIYIVNTCSVTNIAERKSREMLRKCKKENPNSIVIACGCYSQVASADIEKMPEVDFIIGINEKNNILQIINDLKKEKKLEVSDVMNQNTYLDFGNTTYSEKTRAVVKVQDGCDRFCSYCVIPFARGKVRSRNPESILSEIEEISRKGIKEVVLTGIHIASYGKDFGDERSLEIRKKYNYNNDFEKYSYKDDLHTGGFRLIELLEQINKIKEISRIRIGSIEPKLIDEDFINRISKLKKLCHQFHLSLQSGCDSTLKRMNRRYTISEFTNSVKLLREKFNDIVLTTDIIVGFPGETETEFNETYKFLSDIKFYKMHIFKYSPKKGTIAEKMENQVDSTLKEERSKKLLELSDKNEFEYNKSLIGKRVNVLFEETKDGYLQGHTSNFVLVKVKVNGNSNKINNVSDVKITNAEYLYCIGNLD